jgi:hypothetical protein
MQVVQSLWLSPYLGHYPRHNRRFQQLLGAQGSQEVLAIWLCRP